MLAVGHLRRTWLTGLAALLIGALYPLGFAPINWWPLTIVALALYVHLIETHRRPAWIGFCFGVGLFGVGASWVYVSIHDFGHAPWPLAALLTALFVGYLAIYPALSAYLYQYICRRFPALNKALTIALIWSALEAVRSTLFGGFGWLRAGYSLADQPWGAWAPLVGEAGILFFLVLTSALFALKLRSKFVWMLVAIFWLGGSALSFVRWSEPMATSTTVTVVQPSMNQGIKWTPQGLWTLRDRLFGHTELAPKGVVIWPETALPTTLAWMQRNLADRIGTVTKQGKQLVTGIVTQEEARYYNSVVVLDTDAQAVALYHKRRLVPFGEYVPLENWLRGLISFFNLPMSSFHAGSADQPLLTIDEHPVLTAICYEMAFPRLVWPKAEQAHWILTVSNDAWFGHSWGPWQNLQIAQMRARETALPVVRATNSGVSAFIDGQGHITKSLPMFVNERLTQTVVPHRTRAPITRYPWLPELFWVVMALFVIAGAYRAVRL